MISWILFVLLPLSVGTPFLYSLKDKLGLVSYRMPRRVGEYLCVLSRYLVDP